MATKEKLIALGDIVNSETNQRFKAGDELNGFSDAQIAKLKELKQVKTNADSDAKA